MFKNFKKGNNNLLYDFFKIQLKYMTKEKNVFR